MEFALLNRLTAKPEQRERMPLLEGMPEQMKVLPAGGKVPG
jgi:hypothetical protein